MFIFILTCAQNKLTKQLKRYSHSINGKFKHRKGGQCKCKVLKELKSHTLGLIAHWPTAQWMDNPNKQVLISIRVAYN